MSRVALLLGLAFGFLIGAARLNDYDVIHNMLLLRDPYVFLMMGSAVATAMPVLWLLQRRGWNTPLGGPLRLQRAPARPHNVWGSIVFGTGWAVSGSCPGPIIALPAAGTLLGLFVLAGVFVGVGVYERLGAGFVAAESERGCEPQPTPV